MAELDPGVLGAVANTNFKSLGEAPAFYASLAMGNAVAHQEQMRNSMNSYQIELQKLSVANLGKVLDNINNTGVAEALGANKMLTGNDLASIMSALTATMANNQQSVKASQSTPPVT